MVPIPLSHSDEQRLDKNQIINDTCNVALLIINYNALVSVLPKSGRKLKNWIIRNLKLLRHDESLLCGIFTAFVSQ
jgi:hypothetical protein